MQPTAKLESVAAKDSSFPEAPESSRRPRPEMHQDHHDHKLVLVVDDDARTARRLATMLREDGFDAEVAIDGALAIGRLSRSPMPDALVTDLQISHADGSSVVQYARSKQPELPVIVVTGHPQLAHGIDDMSPSIPILPKPVSYEEILFRLTRALTRAI